MKKSLAILAFLLICMTSCGREELLFQQENTPIIGARASIVHGSIEAEDSTLSAKSYRRKDTVEPDTKLRLAGFLISDSLTPLLEDYVDSAYWSIPGTDRLFKSDPLVSFDSAGLMPLIFSIVDRRGDKVSDTVMLLVNSTPQTELIEPAHGSMKQNPRMAGGFLFRWRLSDPDLGDSLKSTIFLSKDPDSLLLSPILSIVGDSTARWLAMLDSMQEYWWTVVLEDRHGQTDTATPARFFTIDPSTSLGRVSGRVLRSFRNEHSGILLKLKSESDTTTTTSTADGSFDFSGLVAGDWTLSSSDTMFPDYRNFDTSFSLPAGGFFLLDSTLLIDSTAPFAVLSSPLTVKIRKPRIVLAVHEGGAGLNLSELDIRVDKKAQLPVFSDGFLSFTPFGNLNDGPHEITADLADLAGNVSTQQIFSFEVSVLHIDLPEDTLISGYFPFVFHASAGPTATLHYWKFAGQSNWSESASGFLIDTLFSASMQPDSVTLTLAVREDFAEQSFLIQQELTLHMLWEKATSFGFLPTNDTLFVGDTLHWTAWYSGVNGNFLSRMARISSLRSDTLQTTDEFYVLQLADTGNSSFIYLDPNRTSPTGDSQKNIVVFPETLRGMKLVPAGNFVDDVRSFCTTENPLWGCDTATVSTSFWMDRREVSKKEFRETMNYDPAPWSDNEEPVTNVSWFEAVLFANAKSKSAGLDTIYSYTLCTGCDAEGHDTFSGWSVAFWRKAFVLPTEDEWELAARAGQQQEYGNGDGSLHCDNINYSVCGWGLAQTDYGLANSYGLSGMSGNASEWVNNYNQLRLNGRWNDQNGLYSDSSIVKGGSVSSETDLLRTGQRQVFSRSSRSPLRGFRLVYRP